jgi:hypothetical protein
MEKDKQFTILSFVGGGIRGLMSVTILEKLYKRFPGLIDHTDLIAGCSTGSIITSELLAGKKPQQLIDFFTDPKGELGFYDAMRTDPRAPAYSIQKVYASQFLLHGPLRVDDLERKKVLFVTFNVGKLETSSEGVMTPVPWQPVMYTNMIPGHGDVEIAKAATSSGAMPGQLGSYDGNVDGAFFNHDPTVAAISLAVRAGHKLENIVAITIGTGLMHDWIASDTGDWGADQWMNGVADPFNSTPPFLMNQSKPGPILDMCLNGTSTELMPMLAGMLLGDRYVNINPRLPFFIPENTTYQQAIDLLQEKGKTADTARAEALIEAYWWDHLPDGPVEQVTSAGTGKKGAAAAAATAVPKAASGGSSASTLNLGPYVIQHMSGNQYVLDVDNGSTANGTPVIGFELKSSGTDNQQWRFVPAGPEAPGWWYLQTMMGTDYVMTLQPHTTSGSGPIVMQPISAADQDTQLWSLQPTETLGYWYIQSKYGASNKQAPAVIVLDGDASAAPALANSIRFTGFETQAWGFKPV